jgi:hypothetical protein
MITIPTGEQVIKCPDLDALAVLKFFARKDGRVDQLIRKIKTTLNSKKANFAQSDLGVAKLVEGGQPRQFVDPTELDKLRKKGRITGKQFLECLCVRTSILKKYLSENEIAAISAPADNDVDGAGALYAEVRPELTVDWKKVEDAMLQAAVE